jgi:hypothetical protein
MSYLPSLPYLLWKRGQGGTPLPVDFSRVNRVSRVKKEVEITTF